MIKRLLGTAKSSYEKELWRVAKSYLIKARAGDWEHALRVVKWVKKIGAGVPDFDLILAAAYLHDIGWCGVAPKGKLVLKEILKLESKANANSAKMLKRALNGFQFSSSQIKKIVQLVKAADKHLAKSESEALIVDSDNLSKLCLAHVRQKYKPSDFMKMVKLWESEMPNRIKTPLAKKSFPQLLKKLKQGIMCSER